MLQLVVVQSSLGQAVLRLLNNFLWTVEKCAEWSLPDHEFDLAEDENKEISEKSRLVRPLPWILFLPSLIILRIIRMTVNIGAFIIGYSQVTPSGLVKFLQTSRKQLNDIKNSGKEKRDKAERLSMKEAKRALIKSIRLTLSSLSCLDTSKSTPSPPPTKIHVSSVLDPDAPTTTSEEKSATESTDATEKQGNLTSSSESEEDEENEEEETLKEKIDRFALESSDEDEDFDPADCSASSIDKSNDENDDDKVNEDDANVSFTELCDIVKDANVLFDRTTAVQSKIEKFQASERAAEQSYHQRIPVKESRDKVEEHLSPTCCTSDRSSQEGDSIFYSPISSDSDTTKASIADKTSGGTNNGAVVEKRNTNVSKCHKGKRTSHGNRRKK